MTFVLTSLPGERAAALYSIGKRRIAAVLALELDASVRTALLKHIPKSALGSPSDDLLLRELAHSNAECRAIVALRCVQNLSKARVTTLPNSYIDNENYRFYDSIHWLDLGVSLPGKLAKSVAEKELARR